MQMEAIEMLESSSFKFVKHFLPELYLYYPFA